MSDEVPAREEIVRSTIITVIFASVFIILGLLFWVWSNSAVDSPITALNDYNLYITIGLEVLFMFGMFVFLTVTAINLRHYLTRIRSGWLEVIVLLIISTSISYLMFEAGVAAASFLLNLGFVVYLYLMQE
ncbi:MAG: hypothetical protein KAQ65_00275 [Candidatus Thorarchaeota archaeon]|nr:hypothetical protein [Candidatus Thorarchaeota archaeon]